MPTRCGSTLNSGGVGADEAHGAIGILANVFGGVGRVFFAGQAILEREGGDANAVEELGGLNAFSVEDEFAETAAGGDENGRAGGFFFGRQEDGDGGVVDVADPVILGLLGDVFAGLESGRAVGPEVDDLWGGLGGGGGGGGGEGEG